MSNAQAFDWKDTPVPATPALNYRAARQNRDRLYLLGRAEVVALGWNRLPSVAVSGEWFRAPQSGGQLEARLE
jgi:hypothetical protein